MAEGLKYMLVLLTDNWFWFLKDSSSFFMPGIEVAKLGNVLVKDSVARRVYEVFIYLSLSKVIFNHNNNKLLCAHCDLSTW